MSLANLTISRKLGLMLLLPLAGLVLLSGGYVISRARVARNAGDVEHLARLAFAISSLTHNSQLERGRSGMYLGARGASYGDQLLAARAGTDSQVAVLDSVLARLPLDHYPAEFRASLDRVLSGWYRHLPDRRAAIDSLKLTPVEATTYFTEMNEAFLDVIARLGAVSTDPALALQLRSYNNLLHAKERAGFERVVLVGVLNHGRFADGSEYIRFLSGVFEQQTYLQRFLAGASAEDRELYLATVHGAAVDSVEQFRRLAMESGGVRPVAMTEQATWFQVATARIGLMKQVTDRLTAEVGERADLLQHQSQQELWLALGGTLLLVLGSTLLAWRIARDLTGRVSHTVTALEAVAGGDLAVELTVHGRDELARIAVALNRAVAAQRDALAQVHTQMTRAETAAREAQVAGEQAREAAAQREAMERAAVEQQRQQAERERLAKEAERAREQSHAEEERRREQAHAERERRDAEELRACVDQILESVSAAAGGDLTHAVADLGNSAIGQVGTGLNRLLDDLNGSLASIGETARSVAQSAAELQSTSDSLSATAEGTSARAETVASGSTEVSRSVNTLAAASEEMNASIQEIARNATEAARVAENAVELANTTSTTATELGASSEEIGQVVRLIAGIAQQTNLLALNATIEAARAGEAGRGFAVVAHEVKELALSTSRATDDITQRVSAIQSRSTRVSEAIGEIRTIISKISMMQTAIASAVEEQTATAQEIGRSVGIAAGGTTEIANHVAGLASAADQTSEESSRTRAAARGLAEAAADLQKLLARFRYRSAELRTPDVPPRNRATTKRRESVGA